MRKNLLFAAFAVILILEAGVGALFAQRGSARGQSNAMEVILASPLPKDSPWGRTLDRIAAEWFRITNGQVRLRVIHDGYEGGEAKMHLSLAGNNIQAAVYTSFGLSRIYPSILTMSAPFLIRNEGELSAVMNEVQSDLEAGFNRGNYYILAWSKAGFVNIFSKEPVLVPDDLKKLRIASNAEAEDMNTAFKTMGYQLVETDWTDVGPKLANNTVMAVYQNPAGVAAYKLQDYMKNMLSLNLAPILGGIVINQVTWRRIGELNPQYQAQLQRATRAIADELDQSMVKTMNDAIATMSREGLKVNRPSATQEQLWFADIERVTPTLVANTYDRALYQKINTILTRYRAGQ